MYKCVDNTPNIMYNKYCQEVQKGGLLDGTIRKRGTQRNGQERN